MCVAAMRKISSRIKFDARRLCFGILLVPASFSCALTAHAGNHVVAWGAGTNVSMSDYNESGQSMVPASLTNAVFVAGGWQHSLTLKADGTIEGWGSDSVGQTNLPAGTNYAAIDCGDLDSVALRSDGTVVATGDFDFYGEDDVPANLSNVVSIACGYYHVLALKADGTLAAWGGQGSVNYGQGSVPASITNVVAIAAGGDHNLVLKSDGALFAWGDGYSGDTNIPAGLSNVVAIAAGGDYNLVLKSDGTLFAWGGNEDGQTNIPAGLSNVVAIAAGAAHNLALKTNGTVIAWGLNNYGQTNVPPNLTNVIQIAAGDLNSLALVGTNPPVRQAALFQPNFGTNGFSMLLPTRNGRVYQLQFKNSLSDQTWQSLPLCAGSGGSLLLTDPAGVPQRFYRVEQW
jgi:alpha-tubulin suppressor-like RCC1 family protein